MPLDELLDRLAAFEPTGLPVISLYLNAQPDHHGRHHFAPFVRKQFKARAQIFPLRSPERQSFERDRARVTSFLDQDLRASANGVAVFACAGEGDFFEAVPLDAPIAEHRFYVYHQPHLYPLAAVLDRYRRYGVVVADTNAARIFVFGLGTTLDRERLDNPKVSRTSVGGWSQMRYQRHIENYHLHHAKELVEVLDRVVVADQLEAIILAGDEVILPVLRRQLPPHLAAKVVDDLPLDITTPEHEVLKATSEAMRARDRQTDADKVQRLLDEYAADGLAVVGVHDTLAALAGGQVDELIVSASLEDIHGDREVVGAALVPGMPADDGDDTSPVRSVVIPDELVTRARQTGAQITFVEEAAPLTAIGGVGAMLRYRA